MYEATLNPLLVDFKNFKNRFSDGSEKYGGMDEAPQHTTDGGKGY